MIGRGVGISDRMNQSMVSIPFGLRASVSIHRIVAGAASSVDLAGLQWGEVARACSNRIPSRANRSTTGISIS